MYACVCVCVCVRERDRERESQKVGWRYSKNTTFFIIENKLLMMYDNNYTISLHLDPHWSDVKPTIRGYHLPVTANSPADRL